MSGLNCWQFKKCGREPGGTKVAELGLCPASTEAKVNGVNHGRNAGRACWAVTGTLCGGKVQGTFAAKMANCMTCDFYTLVGREEGPTGRNPPVIVLIKVDIFGLMAQNQVDYALCISVELEKFPEIRALAEAHRYKTQAEMAECWPGAMSQRTISRALGVIGWTRKKRPMATVSEMSKPDRLS